MPQKPWNYNSEDYEETEFDGTPIKRPSNQVTTFVPGTGYGEAATTDPTVQSKRVKKAAEATAEKAPKKLASKKPVKKASKKKTTSKKAK